MKAKKNKIIFAKLPETEKEFKKMSDDLVEWSREDTSLELNEFPLNLGITPTKFVGLIKLNNYFAEAYEFALEMIGNRIERLAKQGKIDRSFALAILPIYKPSYKKWLLQLKHKEEEEAKGLAKYVVVKMPSFFETPEEQEKFTQKQIDEQLKKYENENDL